MATLADVDPVRTLLEDISLGQPKVHGPLTIVPLLARAAAEPDWLTLGEAGDHVRISEVSEGGSIPHLSVANLADRPLLLLDGEELVGAKQNRVLNTTVLVAAGVELTIPVACVEQGRWHYRGRHFAPGDATLYASLRRKKAAGLGRERGVGHLADQAAIWNDIRRMAATHRVVSPTGAMREFYARHEREMEAARQALAPQPAQVGALVYLRGEWVGLDLLAGPALFGKAWHRLCAGYQADALDAEPGAGLAPPPPEVLARLAASPVEPAPAVGLGAEHRLGGPTAVGVVLTVEQRVAHLMAFPAPAERD